MDGLESVILADPNSKSYDFASKVYYKIKENDGHKISFQEVYFKRFADGETFVKVPENVREKKCYFIHDSSKPANDWVMELILLGDDLLRASAYSFSAVLPYMKYSRQDRKSEPRVPISAKAIADSITANPGGPPKIRRIITTDLHSGQGQGFYNVPVDNLYAFPTMIQYISEKHPYLFENCVMVSPDAGGTHRARAFAKRVYAGLALIDKRRIGPGQTVSEHVIGDVNGKDTLLLDDMIDTGGSMMEGAKALRKFGARSVYACCTHAVFSKDAQSKLVDCFDKIIVTDTIDRDMKSDKIEVISLAGLYSKAIYNASKPGGSLSRLYEDPSPSDEENKSKSSPVTPTSSVAN